MNELLNCIIDALIGCGVGLGVYNLLHGAKQDEEIRELKAMVHCNNSDIDIIRDDVDDIEQKQYQMRRELDKVEEERHDT